MLFHDNWISEVLPDASGRVAADRWTDRSVPGGDHCLDDRYGVGQHCDSVLRNHTWDVLGEGSGRGDQRHPKVSAQGLETTTVAEPDTSSRVQMGGGPMTLTSSLKGAWVLIMAGRAWSVHGRRGIPEGEIKREIDRQAGRR